ncbi:hypothetical protein M758_6G124000 [Ceratodon purpureus]|uniref:Uncharacterized protein n=1 Tax=Ceratodon purpureus TaxID=3225 RepID=A0A8T0HH82_CERPU|nr:hypothetical protein KC19_6G129000 [Ceratodon purpureus]KAG0613711.1 hypothetical protein M758_6G124000 [Ceratodon purpureus]
MLNMLMWCWFCFLSYRLIECLEVLLQSSCLSFSRPLFECRGWKPIIDLRWRSGLKL